MRIKLGQKVRDTITGLESTATARVEFLYGCVRVAVQPSEVKDGKPVDFTYIDEPQLEAIPKPSIARGKRWWQFGWAPAGDRPDPTRPRDP